MKGKSKVEVTQEEIQRALKKFTEKGGLINKLPDEIAPRNALVGGKWGMFEGVGEPGSGA